MLELGIEIIVNTTLEAFDGEAATLGCIYSGRRQQRAAATLVLVTSREPQDALYRELVPDTDEPLPFSIERIGDCSQPALIAHAVYSGHKAGRELGRPHGPVRRDRALIR